MITGNQICSQGQQDEQHLRACVAFPSTTSHEPAWGHALETGVLALGKLAWLSGVAWHSQGADLMHTGGLYSYHFVIHPATGHKLMRFLW